MKLSDDTIAKIKAEYTEWESQLWAGKDLKERQKLGQFATPPELTVKMLEKFDSIKDKDVLDPTVGAGSLLAAAVIAGADPKRVYGIELDEKVLEVCRQRLGKLGVPAANLKCGNALDSDAYKFGNEAKPVAHDQEAIYIRLGDACSIAQLKFPDIVVAEHAVCLKTELGKKLLGAALEDAEARGIWTVFSENTPLAYKQPKSFCMSIDCIRKTAKEQKLNSFDDLVPFAESHEQEAEELEEAEKPVLPECRDASSIIGRKMEEIIASMPSASASGIWRAWAAEAKAAYARYNAWKTGKPAAEVKSVHAAYRQWKIDEESVWCKHFGKANPNDKQRKKNGS